MEGKRQPIGIELVRKGVVTEADIEKALRYQKQHTNKKLGDIINILELCEPTTLLEAMGDILGEKTIYLQSSDIQINIEEYISIDTMKQSKVIPFQISMGKIKVCFADTANKRTMETVRLLLLNKGLIMDRYITFESNIMKIIEELSGRVSEKINVGDEITPLVDSVIKTAMDKRTSDIHIEPMENSVRIRYRIDGELITIAEVEKEKQAQLIGRLKAISNMHQEKQEAQDGRIVMYPDYNIRVSSQKSIYGEKFVLRLLKKNQNIKTIFELGFPEDEKLIKQAFNKRNSIAVVAAPTGEGKTTTLYSAIHMLNRPEINITTIEDPVEIRIPGINQIEIDSKTSFSDSLRTILRQDPDIILVGEIRDNETAEIAIQSGQTGHFVLSTIHTIDSIEVITRLRKFGVTDYDIASTLATSISQRLLRKVCPHCAKQREFTEEEKKIMNEIVEPYGETIDWTDKYTFDAVGCKICNNTGYYERIGIFEVFLVTDEMRELIVQGKSSFEIKKGALQQGYRPLIVDGMHKVLSGLTTLQELNNKLVIY